MTLAEFGSGQVFWSVLWIFLFVVWFWLLITVFADLFRDREASGWVKAGWIVFVIVLPWLGILVYLIVRGHGMSERALHQQQEAQAQFDDYVRQTTGGSSAADQLAKLAELHDKGKLTDAEFASAKANITR